MNISKAKTVISWVLVILLALVYLLISYGKLSGAAAPLFEKWGYPAWFAIFIGVCELAGGIGLLIPKLTKWAILGLTAIMLGAAYTHLASGEGLAVIRPLIFMGVLWAVWFLRGYSFSLSK